ncbi:MAG: 30S ribosomal protein S16 [Candidatus Aerophobetes bacterium]|nr:30S ribosomal protein S16 [Candidatus Aerophobetes bacterium]
MLKIRFFRTGKKNRPFFRIVVTNSTNPPQGGRFKEKLGFFDPLKHKAEINFERIKYWISVGAQPSNSVRNLLIEKGVIKGKKVAVHLKKKQSSEKEEGEKKQEETLGEEKNKEPEEEKPEEATEEKQEEVLQKTKKAPTEKEQEKDSSSVNQKKEKDN